MIMIMYDIDDTIDQQCMYANPNACTIYTVLFILVGS